jgi:hypothetical protein
MQGFSCKIKSCCGKYRKYFKIISQGIFQSNITLKSWNASLFFHVSIFFACLHCVKHRKNSEVKELFSEITSMYLWQWNIKCILYYLVTGPCKPFCIPSTAHCFGKLIFSFLWYNGLETSRPIGLLTISWFPNALTVKGRPPPQCTFHFMVLYFLPDDGRYKLPKHVVCVLTIKTVRKEEPISDTRVVMQFPEIYWSFTYDESFNCCYF